MPLIFRVGGESTSPHTGSFPGPPLWNCPHAYARSLPTGQLALFQNNLSGERGNMFVETLEGGFEPRIPSRVGVKALPLVSYSLR